MGGWKQGRQCSSGAGASSGCLLSGLCVEPRAAPAAAQTHMAPSPPRHQGTQLGASGVAAGGKSLPRAEQEKEQPALFEASGKLRPGAA